VISDKEYNSKTDVKIEKGWIKEVEMIMVSNESAVGHRPRIHLLLQQIKIKNSTEIREN
jgi:hypothetical protein